MKSVFERIIAAFIVFCVIIGNFNAGIIAKAMSNDEITEALNQLQDKYPNGSYWIPTNELRWGGYQCYSYARQLGMEVFGSYPAINIINAIDGQESNGWIAVKNKANLQLEPGDIIRADNNSHTAMIWKIEGQNVYVAQCFGSSGNKINWGPFWGSNPKYTIDQLLDSGFNGVWKHPSGIIYNGNTEPPKNDVSEETYVNIRNESLPYSPYPYQSAFEISGVLESNRKIVEVWGGVYYEDYSAPVPGAYADVAVNAYSYDLSGAVNYKVIFNILPDNARYHYLFTVKTEDGKLFHPIDHEFYIGNPAPTEHTHDLVEDSRKEPTCTEAGYIRRICGCGYSETEEIPAHGHEFKKVRIEPDYGTDGKIIDVCTLCDYQEVIENIPRIIRKGDLDENGRVDLSDLSLLALYNIKDVSLTDRQVMAADVTDDGETNLADLAKMKQFLANKISEL